MTERLRAAQPIAPGVLESIGTARAAAIGAVLREAGVAAARIEAGKTEPVGAGPA
ncbi:MAG TPA: hypothetical protein VIS77_10480 [Burkholderiales bacterium]